MAVLVEAISHRRRAIFGKGGYSSVGVLVYTSLVCTVFSSNLARLCLPAEASAQAGIAIGFEMSSRTGTVVSHS